MRNISYVPNLVADKNDIKNLYYQAADEKLVARTIRNPLILCDQDVQSRTSQQSSHSLQREKDRSCMLKTKCSFTKLKIIKR